MAQLAFFSGTMDCGKSTLALQMEHNHRARGHDGLVFTRHDRAGKAVLSSRLGLAREALEVTDELDFWDVVVEHATHGRSLKFLICDEAQFYTGEQVEGLARIVDEMDIDVYAFGITADFRAQLFPGSQRLIELADRVCSLQVEALCWCGRTATHNARVVGQMVVEGDQVVVGDVQQATRAGSVEYEVLWTPLHAADDVARSGVDTDQHPLPFDAGLCPLPSLSASSSGLPPASSPADSAAGQRGATGQ